MYARMPFDFEKGKPERKPGAQSYRSKGESLGQRDRRRSIRVLVSARTGSRSFFFPFPWISTTDFGPRPFRAMVQQPFVSA